MRERVWNYMNEDYDIDDSYAVDIMEDFLKMLGTTLPHSENDFNRASILDDPKMEEFLLNVEMNLSGGG